MDHVSFDRALETLQGPIGRAIDGSRSAAFKLTPLDEDVRVINYDLDHLPYHTKLFGLCLWVCSVESLWSHCESLWNHCESLRVSVESLRVSAEYRLRSLDGVWLVNRTNTLGFETSKFKLLQIKMTKLIIIYLFNST